MSESQVRNVVITGGGSGIGLACARLFLSQGCKVVISGRNAEKLAIASRELITTPELKSRLLTIASDVSTETGAASLARKSLEFLGGIDLLVNNAGLNVKNRTIQELTEDRWREVLAGNLDSAFQCTQAFLPQLRAQKGGLIVYINSIAGKRGNPLGGAAYVAAKFALRGWATALATEEKSHGIRVTSIFPGEVNTPILEVRPNPVTEEHKHAILQPEDVASAVGFVASLPPRASIPELVITPTIYSYI